MKKLSMIGTLAATALLCGVVAAQDATQQQAPTQPPTPPATTETNRPKTEPTMRWPTRVAMEESWRRTTKITAPAIPSLPSSRTWPVDT